MNMYAFTALQTELAREISQRTGSEIGVGQYMHFVDSFHIYGSYFDEFKGFLESLKKRSFEERTFYTEDVQWIIDEARQNIESSLETEKRTGRKGL